jgi:hypothetical protein
MRRACPLTKKPRKTASSASLSVFSGPKKLRQRLQEAEVYSKLYYDSHIEPAVHEAIKNSEPGTSSLSIVKQVTRKLWDAEDAETKQAVAEKVARAQEVAIEPGECDTAQCTAQQYQE